MKRFITVFIAAAFFSALHAPPSIACSTCGCSFNPRRAKSGAMILTPTGTTLGKGHGTAGFLFEHQRFNAIPASNAHAFHHQGIDVHGKDHEEFYNISLGYGLLDDLDIFIVAPVVSKVSVEVEDHDRLGAKDRATGFGDARIIAKYRFWKEHFDASLLAGLKSPTGATSKKKPSGDKFETEQQPGSGSWDLTAGLAVSKNLGPHWSLASAFQYTTRGEGAQEEKLGDVFHYNAGASYALNPLGRYPNISAVLELHSEWARRDHSREDDRVLSSGGTTVLLAPGLTANFTDSVSAFFSFPVPIFQSLGGEHEELRYETIAGLSWHF